MGDLISFESKVEAGVPWSPPRVQGHAFFNFLIQLVGAAFNLKAFGNKKRKAR